METFKINTNKQVIAVETFGDLQVEVSNYGVDIYKIELIENGTSNRQHLCFFTDAFAVYKFIQDSLTYTKV